MALSSSVWRFLLCLLSISVCGAVGAQSVSSISLDVTAQDKRVVIVGSGFSETDEITVAGIPLEKITVTENRIEARLPSGVRLVGGEYVVKVSGKTTARGSLRIASDMAVASAKIEPEASK